jgi:hypothetical protein
MILFFLLAALFNVLICSPRPNQFPAIAVDYYRSRFHPDYYKEELEFFYQIKPRDSSKPSTSNIIEACSVLLPYYIKGKERQKKLREALRWKTDATRLLWFYENHRRMVLNDERCSHNFAVTLLANMLGMEEELSKPTQRVWHGTVNEESGQDTLEAAAATNSDSNTGPIDSLPKKIHNTEEPAYLLFLEAHYDFVNSVYAQMPPNSLLWRELHSHTAIFSIARLFYSPDLRERKKVSFILTNIAKRVFGMLGTQYDESGRQALRVIGDIMVAVSGDIINERALITQRAVGVMFDFSAE